MPLTPPPYPRLNEPLSISWARQLIDWIRESVAPRGDQSTTMVDGNVITAFVPDVEYDGPFKVTLKNKGGTTAEISGGMLYFNRIFVPDCPEKTSIPVQEGFLCIKAEQENETTVSVDYEVVENPGDFPAMSDNSDSAIVFYPVAKISGSDSDGWTVKQILRHQIPHLWAFGPCDEGENA